MRTVRYTPLVKYDGCDGNVIIKKEITSPCLAITCEYPDGSFDIEINDSIPNCDKCFKLFISCDGCAKCDIVEKTICLPDDNGGCPKCFVPDGVGGCKPKCNGLCDETTGDCIDCDDEHPCPGNQICIQGKCVCPTGQVLDENNNCVTCISGTTHPENKCVICIGGEWKPKICPDGKCNPNTGDCSSCIDNGDCGPNKICTENGCICNPVTHVYNPITGECDPKPECDYTSVDPTGCRDCVNGMWVAKADGNGVVYVKNSNGDCIQYPECKCNDTNSCVDKGSACVKKQGTDKCYCNNCASKYCDANTPCGDGCICVGNVCIKKPCVDSPCETGMDCGDGCGCSQEKKCISCLEDPSAAGCNDTGGCDETNCQAGCKEGCTCLDGTSCVSCNNFLCSDTQKCPTGCICVGNVCMGDPNGCKDDLIGTKSCELKAELKSSGCPCPLIVPRAELVSLVGSIGSLPPNGYSAIKRFMPIFSVDLTKLIYGFSNAGWDNVKKIPMLTEYDNYELISYDDAPTGGSVSMNLKGYVNNQVKINGNWVTADSSFVTYNQSKSISNVSSLAFSKTIEMLTNTLNDWVQDTDTHRYQVVKYEFSFEIKSLVFPNKCSYPAITLPTVTINYSDAVYRSAVPDLLMNKQVSDIFFFNGEVDLSTTYHAFSNLYTTDTRDPLGMWFRSEDNTYDKGDIIRKLYLAKDGDSYIDELFGPSSWFDYNNILSLDRGLQNLLPPQGRLLGDMYYQYKTDCKCGTEAVYDFGKLLVCEKDLITSYQFENCNTKIKLNSVRVPSCLINQDLNGFDLVEDEYKYGSPKSKQAIFKLFITTSEGTTQPLTIRHKHGVGMVNAMNDAMVNGTTYDAGKAITKVELKMFYGLSTEVVCTQTIMPSSIDDFKLTFKTTCVDGVGQVAINPPSGYSIISITKVANSGNLVVVNNGLLKSNSSDAATGKIVVQYSYAGNICTKEFYVQIESCCPSFDRVLISSSGFKLDVRNTPIGSTVEYSNKDINSPYIQIPMTNGNGVANNLASGLYSIIVKYGVGENCKKEFTASVGADIDSGYTLTPVYQSVKIGNSSTPVVFKASSDFGGGTLYYIETNANNTYSKQKALDNTGKAILTISGGSITTTFTTVKIVKNLLEVPTPSTAEVNYYSNPIAQITSGPSTITAGQSVDIVLTGTPYATVVLSTGQSVVLGDDGTGVISYTSSIPSGSETITIASVVINNITGTGTGSHIITILGAIVVALGNNICNNSLWRVLSFTTTPATIGTWIAKIGGFNGATIDTGTGSTFTVTVNPSVVNAVWVRYTSNSGVVVENTYSVNSCLCPEIQFTELASPDTLCVDGNVNFSASWVTGGSGVYEYKFTNGSSSTGWISTNNHDFYINSGAPVLIEVKDVNSGCTASKEAAVFIVTPAAHNIESSSSGIVINNNTGTMCNTAAAITFNLANGYEINPSTYSWSVTNYNGTSTGTSSSFTVTPALFSSTSAVLTATYTTTGGCTGTATLNLVINTCYPIENDEVLISSGIGGTTTFYKSQITPSSVGAVSLVANTNHTGGLITITNNTTIHAASRWSSDNKYILSPSTLDINSVQIMSGQVVYELATMTNTALLSTNVKNVINSINVSNGNMTTAYTISDPSWDYLVISMVRTGNTLIAVAVKYPTGTSTFDSWVFLKFTIVSDAITGWAEAGAVLDAVLDTQAYALAMINGEVFAIRKILSAGNAPVYHLNTSGPTVTGSLVGNLVSPDRIDNITAKI